MCYSVIDWVKVERKEREMIVCVEWNNQFNASQVMRMKRSMVIASEQHVNW